MKREGMDAGSYMTHRKDNDAARGQGIGAVRLVARRRLLSVLAASLAWPLWLRPAQAQLSLLDPNVLAFARGAEVRRGRVRLTMPPLADNGNTVSLRVVVDSPMTPQDHVKVIALVSSRNPEPNMARFYLGPRAGRADIATRVRLAGTQRVMAVAEMSDGSFWMDSHEIVVTMSACLDESL
jgi:sulfur-oxidizing protein SoxY